jgi:hypothetical protein
VLPAEQLGVDPLRLLLVLGSVPKKDLENAHRGGAL